MIQHQVQLERVAWLSAFDVLPLVNLETKKRLIEDAVKNRSLLVAVHNPFPGVGRMSAGERGRNVWTAEEPHAMAATEQAVPAD